MASKSFMALCKADLLFLTLPEWLRLMFFYRTLQALARRV
jgi:hypothetical protein